jgi:hypothetical protein
MRGRHLIGASDLAPNGQSVRPRAVVPLGRLTDPALLAQTLRPSTASTTRTKRALHSFPMWGAIWLLPVVGCVAMMGGCAWMRWRMFRRSPGG